MFTKDTKCDSAIEKMVLNELLDAGLPKSSIWKKRKKNMQFCKAQKVKHNKGAL